MIICTCKMRVTNNKYYCYYYNYQVLAWAQTHSQVKYTKWKRTSTSTSTSTRKGMHLFVCLHRGRFHSEIRAVMLTFVLALMLASLVKTRLYRTTNNETCKNDWMHITTSLRKTLLFKNVQKCQYDLVKILCSRNWRNPGISSAISVHKRLSIVYNILLYDKPRKIWKRFQFLSGLRASPPFRRSSLRESEKVSQNKNVSAPREVKELNIKNVFSKVI